MIYNNFHLRPFPAPCRSRAPQACMFCHRQRHRHRWAKCLFLKRLTAALRICNFEFFFVTLRTDVRIAGGTKQRNN